MNAYRRVASVVSRLLAILFVLSGSAVAEDVLVNPEDFFDPSFGDLQEELEIIRDEEKAALLVMFETKDCPWCERMKKQVLNRASVQAFYEDNFRVIALDAEGDLMVVDFDGNEVEESQFALKAMRVRATPVFAFFSPDGELITRYTGALKNADDFILLGEYVIQEKYRDMKFSKYRREHNAKS
ncbi:MAG: thioredoxin fold domain-containing protein [Gammaproteobacteria bacterium]|nr:thioredoxin fold domain-containing protein [Gammaproteobacteria bacterium]MYD75678.1 thioredoxin fold domain-containing protein [Gammaproteobacteria bacterium]MYJ51731.1 thioredoxin fold domain-containing protein [Gammaproteobacteria bacterium]